MKVADSADGSEGNRGDHLQNIHTGTALLFFLNKIQVHTYTLWSIWHPNKKVLAPHSSARRISPFTHEKGKTPTFLHIPQRFHFRVM